MKAPSNLTTGNSRRGHLSRCAQRRQLGCKIRVRGCLRPDPANVSVRLLMMVPRLPVVRWATAARHCATNSGGRRPKGSSVSRSTRVDKIKIKITAQLGALTCMSMILVLATGASLAQQSAGPQVPTDPNLLVRTVIDNELKINEQDHTHWMYRTQRQEGEK